MSTFSPAFSATTRAACRVRPALRNNSPAPGARESSVRLSATVVPGTMPASISWWTVWTPARRASSGVVGANGSPPTSTVPPDASIAPERILISVDFPAPFVPMRPTTSPAATSNEHPAEDLARSVVLGQFRDAQRRRRFNGAGDAILVRSLEDSFAHSAMSAEPRDGDEIGCVQFRNDFDQLADVLDVAITQLLLSDQCRWDDDVLGNFSPPQPAAPRRERPQRRRSTGPSRTWRPTGCPRR